MSVDLSNPSPFTFKKPIQIPKDVDVVFVSDMFVEDYPYGGAELTSEALITSSPFKVFKLHSKDVSMELLRQGFQKYWIFGNFVAMDPNLIPTIIANIRYSILEYDYKFCRYRSTEKHELAEGKPCDCHTEMHGKLMSAFFHGAKAIWWMSEKQKDKYESIFPTLADKPTTVLSSVFDDETFSTIKLLREAAEGQSRRGWIVLGSTSWIKGSDAAEEWCKASGKEYEVVWNVPYHDLLKKLSTAEGFVYLPQGDDTCPRMVIEAKLLGCQLHINDKVQHASEEWFNADMLTLESYLYMARSRFWNGTHSDMGEEVTTISGYTTTYNCIEHDYPFIESINSLLGFCDEVVVVDAGSYDGTWERLKEVAAFQPKLKIHQQKRDRSKRRWAIDFDGRQKALARSLCTSAFCWQQDVDEVVHENDYTKITTIVKHFPKDVHILCLPVIEYWGSQGKVRSDIHNWKWRLSRNLPGITHGIPRQLRRYDEEGELFAAQGTDSCDMIWLHDYTHVPAANFYTADVDDVRKQGMQGNSQALEDYEGWYNEVALGIPGVQHYSWFNIKRKIRSYKGYWSRFWESMYNMKQDDTAENNMFFDKPWSEVSYDEMSTLAHELEDKLGGWIFHRKVRLDADVPHINCAKQHPQIMSEWIDRNKCG